MLFIPTSELMANVVLNSFNYYLTNKDERIRMKIDNVTIDYKLDYGMLSVEFLDYDGEHFRINLFAFDRSQNLIGSHKLSTKNLTSNDICYRVIEAFLIVHFSDNCRLGDAKVATDLMYRIKNKWPFKIY